jgi:hypothetical protein
MNGKQTTATCPGVGSGTDGMSNLILLSDSELALVTGDPGTGVVVGISGIGIDLGAGNRGRGSGTGPSGHRQQRRHRHRHQQADSRSGLAL